MGICTAWRGEVTPVYQTKETLLRSFFLYDFVLVLLPWQMGDVEGDRSLHGGEKILSRSYGTFAVWHTLGYNKCNSMSNETLYKYAKKGPLK